MNDFIGARLFETSKQYNQPMRITQFNSISTNR